MENGASNSFFFILLTRNAHLESEMGIPLFSLYDVYAT